MPDPLTDAILVDSSARILTLLAREWVAGENPERRLTVLDLQEALHAFEMQKAARPIPAMTGDQAARKGYWVGWSTAPQPVLTDSLEIMKYGTGPMPVVTEPVTEELAVNSETLPQDGQVSRRRRSRKDKERPDVESDEHAPAGDAGPAVAGEILELDPAAGDQGDVSDTAGQVP